MLQLTVANSVERLFLWLDVFGHGGESVQRCRLRGELWQETMFPLVFKNHLQGELMKECIDTRWRSQKASLCFIPFT